MFAREYVFYMYKLNSINLEPQGEIFKLDENLSSSLIENKKATKRCTLSGSRFDNTVIPTPQNAHHPSLRPRTTRVPSGGKHSNRAKEKERERKRKRELRTCLLKKEKKCASECVIHIYITIYAQP